MRLKGMSALGEPIAPAAASVAAEAMVRCHLPWVWRYLRAHGATAHEADDLAQDTFVVALRKDASGLPPAATAAFLRRTARHLLLRARRRQRGAVELADAVDELWRRDCADGGEELLAALRACVGLLGPRTRRALELAYGYASATSERASRAAVARHLDMTENGVKTLLQRARQRLRLCLTRKRP
jgi:RNA polymerase sigma factor (sigma-70 family)